MGEYIKGIAVKGEHIFQLYEAEEAAVISAERRCPVLSTERIEKYICHWTDELLDEANTAYEDDDSSYGDAWQLIDFLETLGFRYPGLMPTKKMDIQMPSLREILEQNISSFTGEGGVEEYALIDKLPSAFSHDYIRDLLEEEGVQAFGFEDKTPVLAAFCSFWLLPGSGWNFLDRATYEPVCLNYEKPTDIYLLRARVAITEFSKRHRAFRDIKRLLELDPENSELYQAEIKKWNDKEQEWRENLRKR